MEGFETTVQFDPHTAFPVPHNRPLCHLSGRRNVLSGLVLRHVSLPFNCRARQGAGFLLKTGRRSYRAGGNDGNRLRVPYL